jgi:hypothetical protein
MGIAAKRPSVSDLFSTSSDQEPSSSSCRSATPPRKQATAAPSSAQHVLPYDLTTAIQHLDDEELDRLYSAVLDEQKRRCKKLLNSDNRRERIEAPTPSLTSGQVKAVRAAFRIEESLENVALRKRVPRALVREPINLQGVRLARVRHAPIATKFRSAGECRDVREPEAPGAPPHGLCDSALP